MKPAYFETTAYEWHAPNGALYSVSSVGSAATGKFWVFYAHKPTGKECYKNTTFQSFGSASAAMEACVGHYATLEAAALPDEVTQVSP
jgi:hypothetical protein